MASSSFPPAPAGGAAPIHLVSEDDQNRGNGWLGTVPNPLQRLGRFLGRGRTSIKALQPRQMIAWQRLLRR